MREMQIQYFDDDTEENDDEEKRNIINVDIFSDRKFLWNRKKKNQLVKVDEYEKQVEKSEHFQFILIKQLFCVFFSSISQFQRINLDYYYFYSLSILIGLVRSICWTMYIDILISAMANCKVQDFVSLFLMFFEINFMVSRPHCSRLYKEQKQLHMK